MVISQGSFGLTAAVMDFPLGSPAWDLALRHVFAAGKAKAAESVCN